MGLKLVCAVGVRSHATMDYNVLSVILKTRRFTIHTFVQDLSELLHGKDTRENRIRMKKVIKPAIPAEETYICDLCGEEIEQDTYGTSVVEIVVHEIGGNGWNEWPEKHVYHSHRRCLSTALDLMERNGGKKYGKIL